MCSSYSNFISGYFEDAAEWIVALKKSQGTQKHTGQSVEKLYHVLEMENPQPRTGLTFLLSKIGGTFARSEPARASGATGNQQLKNCSITWCTSKPGTVLSLCPTV